MPVIAPPPPGDTIGEMPSLMPPPPNLPDTVRAVDIAENPPPDDALPAEVRIEMEGLRRRVRAGRRRTVLLRNATAVVLVSAAACWAAHYAVSVLSYARIDQDIRIERTAADPSRVRLRYRPLSEGTIAFRRADGNRETELLDQVLPNTLGKEQAFEWRIRGVASGDPIKVTFLNGWSLQTREMRVPPAAEEPRLGTGLLAGRILNQITRRPVPGAEVRIPGTNLKTVTDAEGRFRIQGAPTGSLPVEFSADGFTTKRFEQEVVAGAETALRVDLKPGMDLGQIRIVLTWPGKPKDLDAHLEGPLPGGERFHVDYRHQGDLNRREYVRLDGDNREGQGTETVTVLGVRKGTYRYFVYDFSNRNDPQSSALAQSGAEVTLYQGGQTYHFTAGHEMPGNLWDVCTIEVSDDGATVTKVDRYRGVKAATLGLYDKRTQPDRKHWIVNYGGNEQSEAAVAEGLQWLVRHQAADGSWSNRCLGTGPDSRCEQGSPCTDAGGVYEMAHTGLALLALQAAGHYYCNNAPYSDVVRKGLDWMVEHQRDDGALVGTHDRGGYAVYHKNYMYEHGIAAFALNEACAVAASMNQPENPRYVDGAKKAVRFIEGQQHLDGGWRYSSDLREPSDTSVSGWQALALKAAKEAGIAVNPRCTENIRDFFTHMEAGEDGRTLYMKDDPVRTQQSEATTGIGMWVRQLLLAEPDAPMIQKAAAYLADLAEGYARQGVVKERGQTYRLEYNYYTWYNCTLAMFRVGGEPWQRWNRIIRDTLIRLQRHDGCARGSWDADTLWGERGGRIYTTALAILTLEVYYRYAVDEDIDPQLFELNALDPSSTQHDPAAEPAPDGTGSE